MKILYKEVNGHRYAYKCTSHRVPGRKDPVSDKTYLGRVDPVTGEIIPKKSRSSRADWPVSGFKVFDYGDVFLLERVARETGLSDDLNDVFGTTAPMILALSMARLTHHSNSADVRIFLDNSYVCEMLGITRNPSQGFRLGETTSSLDQDDILTFFRRRR